MPATTKRTTKTKKAKAFLIKPRTFTIDPDTNGVFSAQDFSWAIARAFEHSNPVFQYTRYLTIAELEAAEAFAHQQMTNRVENGPDGIPVCVADELVEYPECVQVGADELISWAYDVQSEAQAWVKIANELLVARARAAEVKKAA